MGYVVRMPKLGLEMDRGTLIEWRIDAGESVNEGDVIADIESEKTSAEVDSREDGVLRKTYLEPGETVEPGDPIGIVATNDEDISELGSADRGDRRRIGRSDGCRIDQID